MKSKIAIILGVLCISASISIGQTTNTVTVTQTTTVVTNVPNLLGALPLNSVDSGLLQEVWDDYLLSTNSGISLAAGMDTKFKKTILSADYLYDFNGTAGLIFGWDTIFGGPKTNSSVANAVRGGLQLQAALTPFKSLGYTNFTVHPFGGELVSTVVSGPNSGNIGLVSMAGVDLNLYKFGWGTWHGGGLYENRTAQGWASGNYWLAETALTFNHLKAGGQPW